MKNEPLEKIPFLREKAMDEDPKENRRIYSRRPSWNMMKCSAGKTCRAFLFVVFS